MPISLANERFISNSNFGTLFFKYYLSILLLSIYISSRSLKILFEANLDLFSTLISFPNSAFSLIFTSKREKFESSFDTPNLSGLSQRVSKIIKLASAMINLSNQTMVKALYILLALIRCGVRSVCHLFLALLCGLRRIAGTS